MQWCEKDYKTETWSLSAGASQKPNCGGEGESLTDLDGGTKWLQIVLPDVLEKDLIEIMHIFSVSDYTIYDPRKGEQGLLGFAENNIMLTAEVDKNTLFLVLDELNQYIQNGHQLQVFSSDVEIMTSYN